MTPRTLGFIRVGRRRFCDPRQAQDHGVWVTVWKLDPQGRLEL